MRDGTDSCPWHGLGTIGISRFEIEGRWYSITGAKREVLDRRRNGLDFGTNQEVLLRWHSNQQHKHLMWIPAHIYALSHNAPSSLQFESRPQTSSLYIPKTILMAERLSGLLLARKAEKISKVANLPREVIDKLASIYTPSNTYYLIGESQPDE